MESKKIEINPARVAILATEAKKQKKTIDQYVEDRIDMSIIRKTEAETDEYYTMGDMRKMFELKYGMELEV